MKSHSVLSIVSILALLPFILLGCGSDPEEVVAPQGIATQEVIVTREVVVTKEVEVTRVVEVTRAVDASAKAAATPTTLAPTSTPRLTPTPTPPPAPLSAVIPEGWSQYDSASGRYSVAYPPNWSIQSEGLTTLELQISISEYITIGFLPHVHQAVLGEYSDRVQYLKVLVTGLVEELGQGMKTGLSDLTFHGEGEVDAPNNPVYVTASWVNSEYIKRTQSMLMTYATDGQAISQVVYINYNSEAVRDETIKAIEGVVRSIVFE
jgi:hypothetical protein